MAYVHSYLIAIAHQHRRAIGSYQRHHIKMASAYGAAMAAK